MGISVYLFHIPNQKSVNRDMRIEDIIQPEDSREELSIIAERCTDFIELSEGNPILKNLSNSYGDFHKIKVRKRKGDKFTKMFNEAFTQELENLRERSIFANGNLTFKESDNPDLEPFYIFPIDGFQYMYSKEVENSSTNYKNAFDAILEQLGKEEGKNIITELLKFNYTSDNLVEGIQSGSEIIIYNIPYFYGIKKETVDDYSQLIKQVKELE